MTHDYQQRCHKCGRVADRSDDKTPENVSTVIVGSCLACTPESIMTSYYYLDAQGNRVGQDAANLRKIKGALKV